MLLVLRNVKERNKQYIKSFLKKPVKEFIFLVKLQTRSLLTALLKNYVLHSYFRTIWLEVWVIAYSIQAINFLMSGGNKRSYT